MFSRGNVKQVSRAYSRLIPSITMCENFQQHSIPIKVFLLSLQVLRSKERGKCGIVEATGLHIHPQDPAVQPAPPLHKDKGRSRVNRDSVFRWCIMVLIILEM